jgi:hypothetical protein
MRKYELYFVHFIVDEVYQNSIAKLKIQPKADAMKRVFMVYQKAVLGMEEKEQVFKSFKRSGLTLIEWGGTELPPSYITLTK